MPMDCVFNLPRSTQAQPTIESVLVSVLEKGFAGAIVAHDPDSAFLEEFAEDFAADTSEDDGIECMIRLTRELVEGSEDTDSVDSHLDEAGFPWGHISISLGTPDSEGSIVLDGHYNKCMGTMVEIASELSIALGGTGECDYY